MGLEPLGKHLRPKRLIGENVASEDAAAGIVSCRYRAPISPQDVPPQDWYLRE
jgi:hypothetical protein